MKDCRRIAEQLTPFVDGALPPGEEAVVERHLDACPPCRTAAMEERGAREVLRHCAGRLRKETVPPGLRTRCSTLAREHARGTVTGRGWQARFAPAFLVALLLVFTASAIFSLATHRSDAVLAAQLTADHVRCFRLFASPDSPAADAAQVEAGLAERFGWNVHVPPSSPAAGVTLIGARRCLYGEGTAAHVMYRVNGEDMSLYMLEGMRDMADLRTVGHRSRIWSRGDTTYVLVTPSKAGELSAATRYVMQTVH